MANGLDLTTYTSRDQFTATAGPLDRPAPRRPAVLQPEGRRDLPRRDVYIGNGQMVHAASHKYGVIQGPFI